MAVNIRSIDPVNDIVELLPYLPPMEMSGSRYPEVNTITALDSTIDGLMDQIQALRNLVQDQRKSLHDKLLFEFGQGEIDSARKSYVNALNRR